MTQDFIQQIVSVGNFSSLVCNLESSLLDEPNLLDSYAFLGILYLLEGKEREAEELWMELMLNNLLVEDSNFLEFLNAILEELSFKFLQTEQYQFASILINKIKEISNVSDELNAYIQFITDNLVKEALSCSLYEYYNQAKSLFLSALQLRPQDPYLWHNLGVLYFQQFKYDQATSAIQEALTIDSTIAQHHYTLGLVLEKKHQFSEAKSSYEKAIILDQNLTDSYNNLAILENKLGNNERAENILKDVIQKFPKFVGAYVNLGNLYVKKHRYQEAIKLYEKAYQIDDKNTESLLNLAFCYQNTGNNDFANYFYGFYYFKKENFHECIAYLRNYIQEAENNINAYTMLGIAYQETGQIEKSIQIYEMGTKFFPQETLFYQKLIASHERNNSPERVLSVIQKAQKNINNFAEKFYPYSFIFPVVYRNEQEIKKYRDKFANNLNQLNRLSLDDPHNLQFAFQIISSRTNYYLHFQNKNDCALQKQYGNFLHKVMSRLYPQWSLPIKYRIKSDDKKIKIGYISQRIQKGLGELFLGWIKYLDREKFEVYCFDFNNTTGSENPALAIHSDFYFYFDNFDDVTVALDKYQLDILVFFDLGLDPLMSLIASLRFAPIQCATWGHPITSGLPTIDYFLSSELMEVDTPDYHYSEKVVKLKNLGLIPNKISYNGFHFSENILYSKYQVSDDNVVYLSCQHITKYLPQYDYLYAKIAEKVDYAKFIFVEGYQSPNANITLKHRLESSFQQYNLDFNKFCIFIPRLEMREYYDSLRTSDVFLDTIGWSGGLTSLDALAYALPIVTYPGEFLRGRQSYGMLHLIKVTDTIAESLEEYVNIAVNLAINPQERKRIKQKIKNNISLLYEYQETIEDLQNFYISALNF